MTSSPRPNGGRRKPLIVVSGCRCPAYCTSYYDVLYIIPYSYEESHGYAFFLFAFALCRTRVFPDKKEEENKRASHFRPAHTIPGIYTQYINKMKTRINTLRYIHKPYQIFPTTTNCITVLLQNTVRVKIDKTMKQASHCPRGRCPPDRKFLPYEASHGCAFCLCFCFLPSRSFSGNKKKRTILNLTMFYLV